MAPDLLFTEMANLAARGVRRSMASIEQGTIAVATLGALLDETIPAPMLAPRSFELAATHGLSAYDATYPRKIGLGHFLRFLA